MTYDIVLLAALVVAVAVCVVLAVRLRARQQGPVDLPARLETAMNAEKSALRQLRLASHNLRAIGMSLQGHAEHLDAGGTPHLAGIANAAVGVLDIADYMHEWAEHAESTHVLNEEVLSLRNALDEAVSTVSLAIRPGRRTWQIDPDILAMRLRADRRALRHVLTRALSVAARASGREDCIEVRSEGAELDGARRAVALIIEAPAAPRDAGGAIVTGSGPDLRLTLARALLDAHGGKLDIEQRDGLSLRIILPADRIVRAADAAPEPPKAEVAGREHDDRVQGSSVS